MGNRFTYACAVLLIALAAPVTAWAAESSSAPTASAEASRTYDLDFTLPTAGKSGCVVCHGDPNLVKLSAESTSTVYVDPVLMAETAHGDTVCTGCHIDFAYKTPHQNVVEGAEWSDVAKSACKNCHQSQFSQVVSGAHSPSGEPGKTEAEIQAARLAEGKPAETPLCGDCHGSHEISYIDVETWEASGTVEVQEAAREGAAAMHGTGNEMCGGCHEEEATTYADYYHGAAYNEGAPDAPACWDCHGAHEMLPTDDLRSPVNPANLEKTCGQCHDDVNEEYVKYAELVHNREQVEDEIPLYTFWESARAAVSNAIETVGSWFGGEG